MVRYYKRKTQRRPYTQIQFDEAIEKIRNGELTLYRCAREYSIPRETLRDHLKGRRGSKGPTVGGGGRKTILSTKQENELAVCLRVMSKCGFGLSRTEVFDLVQKYVKRNKIITSFKDGRPGEDWWLLFKERHNLSIKKPEILEHARKNASNPFIIYGFFDLLEETIVELGLQDRPQQIWNCDETSFCHDPSRTKVVAAIGQSCHRQTAGTGRESTTVLACVNALGGKMAPLIIFKGKNLWDAWIPQSGDYPNTSYTATSKGWMTAQIFENWFKRRFVMDIGIERPVLLIFDGHSSHITPELIIAAQENQITILKLPAHTSHLLQPLDVSCFRGLKIKWDKNLTTWQRCNIGTRPGKAPFAKLLGGVWSNLTEVNIISGFKATGIYDPAIDNILKVNRKAISKKIFTTNDLERYNCYKHKNANPRPIIDITDNSGPANDTSSNNLLEAASLVSYQVPSCNCNRIRDSTSSKSLNSSPEKSFERLLLESVRSPNMSVEAIRKKRKVASGAEVLTREQVSIRLEKATASVSVTKSRGRPPKQKKIPTLSSSESDTLSEISSSSTDNDEEINKDDSQDTFAETGDFVLVKFTTKRTIRHYVGQVIGKTYECQVKFLRCVNEKSGRFIWPTKDDLSVVEMEDIVKKLPHPVVDRREGVVFNINFSHYNM